MTEQEDIQETHAFHVTLPLVPFGPMNPGFGNDAEGDQANQEPDRYCPHGRQSSPRISECVEHEKQYAGE